MHTKTDEYQAKKPENGNGGYRSDVLGWGSTDKADFELRQS